MQSNEFQKYFDQFPFLVTRFKGIFSIDTLPKILKLHNFCICNTDKSTGVGIHWISFFRWSKSLVLCFDSLKIDENKKALLIQYCNFHGVKEILFNETEFQLKDTDTCGLYNVYFLINCCYNLDLSFVELLESIFIPNNNQENEKLVDDFCSKILSF